MNEKKTRDANLDRFRVPLLFLGLLFSSAFVLTAFEWKTYAEAPKLETEMEWRDLPDEIIFTAVAMKKPLPPPPAPAPVVDVLVLIDDDKPTYQDLKIPDIDFIVEPVVVEIATKKEEFSEEILEGYMDDVMPGFPGGDSALMEYLGQNIRYPIKSKRAGRQGTVWVEFVVGKDGKIEGANILNGIDEACNDEVLRVVNQMPVWTPGKQRGIPVKVRYKLPVTYKLRN